MTLGSTTRVNNRRTQQSQSLKHTTPKIQLKTPSSLYFAADKNNKENIKPQHNISTGPATPKHNTDTHPAQDGVHTPEQNFDQQSDWLSPPHTPKFKKIDFNDTDQTQPSKHTRSSNRPSGFMFKNSTQTIASGSSAIIAEISESLTQRAIPHYSDKSNTEYRTLMPLNSFNGKIQCTTPTKGTPKSKTPLAIRNKFIETDLPRKDCISIKAYSAPSHVSNNKRVDDSNNTSICPPIIKEKMCVSTYAKTTITESDSVQISRVLTKELCALGITIKKNYFQVKPNKLAPKDFNITQQQVKKSSAESILKKWYNKIIQPSDKISKESKQYLKSIIEGSKHELRHANPKTISGSQSQTADNLFPGPRQTNCFDFCVERALVEVSKENNIIFKVAVISTCSQDGKIEYKRKYQITRQRTSELIDIIEIKYATFLSSTPPEDLVETIKSVLKQATQP